MQCPVNSAYQAALGLLLAGMALHNASAAARVCPEAVNFVTATLRAYLPPEPAAAAAGSKQQRKAAAAAFNCVSRFTPGLLAFDSCKAAAAAAAAPAGGSKRGKKQRQQQAGSGQQEIPSIKLYQLLSSAADDQQFSTDAFKLQLLGCAVNTAFRALQLGHGCGSAVPEMLQPLCAAAEAVGVLQGLPAAAAAAVHGLQQELSSKIQEAVDKRQPMVQSHRCACDALPGFALSRRVGCSQRVVHTLLLVTEYQCVWTTLGNILQDVGVDTGRARLFHWWPGTIMHFSTRVVCRAVLCCALLRVSQGEGCAAA
jgi:hypothetical protein